MARPPLDVLPQRELLGRLRVEIPRAMDGRRIALKRVDALVEDNPRSWSSTYVTYNLGKRKAAWLAARVAASRDARALPRRRDAEPHS